MEREVAPRSRWTSQYVSYVRHIPTWIEQIKILKEEKALEIQNQQFKLKEELEGKQSHLKR